MAMSWRNLLSSALPPILAVVITLALVAIFISSPGSPKESDELEASFTPLVFPLVALLIGAVVSTVTPWIRLPYTVILLMSGLVLGCVHFYSDLGRFGASVEWWRNIESDLFLSIFLPALVFHSSFALQSHTLFKGLGQVLLLAGPGVVINAFLTGVVGRYVLPYNWYCIASDALEGPFGSNG